MSDSELSTMRRRVNPTPEEADDEDDDDRTLSVTEPGRELSRLLSGGKSPLASGNVLQSGVHPILGIEQKSAKHEDLFKRQFRNREEEEYKVPDRFNNSVDIDRSKNYLTQQLNEQKKMRNDINVQITKAGAFDIIPLEQRRDKIDETINELEKELKRVGRARARRNKKKPVERTPVDTRSQQSLGQFGFEYPR
jgi:hypothetical protein